MTAGESCTFKVKAACGAPGFRIKDESKFQGYEITYLEFDEESVDKDEKGKDIKKD